MRRGSHLRSGSLPARSAKLSGVYSLTLLAAVPNQHLPGVLHALEPTLNHYGYLAVAGLVLVEDFGIPVPGETVLILGAVYAGAGRLNVALVALLGFLGAVTGDNIGFAIGHFGGRRLLDRYGRYILLTPERLDRATAFFERHGGKIITVARFIEGLRQANGIIAGSTGMHWAKFLFFNAVGAALWVALWVSVGYFSGSHIDSIYHEVTRYSTYFAIAVGVVLVTYIGRRVIRARARRRAAADWRAADGGGAPERAGPATNPAEPATNPAEPGKDPAEPAKDPTESAKDPAESAPAPAEPEPASTNPHGGRTAEYGPGDPNEEAVPVNEEAVDVNKAVEQDERQRELWRRGAEGWERRQKSLREKTLPVAQWLVDALNPQPGERIVELAAGPGETGFMAAQRLGEEGHLLSTDQAPEMIEVARRRAAELELTNVDFAVIDAQRLELPPGSFDGALCRWGYMLMAQPTEAMRRTRSALHEGGRLALATWDRPDRNLWLAAPVLALVANGSMPPPNPADPSPFALPDPADIEQRLRSAGFGSVRTDHVEFRQRYASFEEYWGETMDLAAPLADVIDGLPAGEADTVAAAARQTLSQFIGDDGAMAVPASAVVALAVA